MTEQQAFTSAPIDELILEGKWATIKAIRDAYLKSTDWIVTRSQERNEPLPQELKEYRQALRDLPQTFAHPDEVVWPTKPNF